MPDTSVRIFFAGDFCSRPSTTKITVSDELKHLIQSCNLNVVNFEVPLKPQVELAPRGRQRYYQHDDAPNFLRSLGFNLFQIANNHTFDWDDAGYYKTKDALGDAAFGAGTYEEAYKVKIVEVNGVRIGFMALSFAAYNGVFDDVSKQDGLGCAYINDLKVNHIIMEAKKSADFVFVLPHDGIEYIDVPLPETIARYRDFIDYGADGVIGTHTHCPQGWESYKGKPIFYSLGNFLFNSKEGYDYRANNRPHWYEGICVVMNICGGGLKWEVVNTRNVDNVGITLDNSEERSQHNDRICEYLNDKGKYWNYFGRVCEKEGYIPFTNIVDRTMHLRNLTECSKVLIKNWYHKLFNKRKYNSDDVALERLLKHDTNRQLVLWSLKMHGKTAK